VLCSRPVSSQRTAAPSTWESLAEVATSWRLASVALLSFSSGLPLGLVWIAIPAWMARAGIDIKVIGLFTLAQAPWSFKFLWSPFMDRYPLPFLGRKRGWILVSQVALIGFGLWLAAVSNRPEAVWVIGSLALAIGFASATHDIAYDGYTVEVLRKEEQGVAVGARTALYRVAMFVSGGASITLAASWSWTVVNLVLALCYLPFLFVTWRAPEPELLPEPPKTLRDAVWGPFVGLMGQHRALEILAFVVLFKLSDNLTQALLRPFFVQMGFSDLDVGVATMSLGTGGILVGVFLGGLLTQAVGLGPALWISGLLQMFSNLGYAVVAEVPTQPVLYAAQLFEYATSGLGTGAFGVLLLRLTQKRFSATQFALLSSLFALPRILAGPPTGLLVDAIGWRDFFIFTVFTGLPGLLMLHRFVPWGMRDPVFHVAAPSRGLPLPVGGLTLRAALGAVLGWGASICTLACLEAMRAARAGRGFRPLDQLGPFLQPTTVGQWTTAVGLILVGLFTGLAVAAALAARRGMASREVIAD
jgi:PAT family beta-lactamase induction signal transducer AmpG